MMVSDDIMGEISHGSIIMAGSGSKKYYQKIIAFLKEAINKRGLHCIYITFNKPCKVLSKEFEIEGIDVSKIHFIDAITRLSEDVDMEKNCAYIDSPKDLNMVSIYVRNSLESDAQAKKFVVLDSINNLMNFVPTNEALAFIQTITNKLRLIEVSGTLMAVQEHGKEPAVLKDLKRIVDKQMILA